MSFDLCSISTGLGAMAAACLLSAVLTGVVLKIARAIGARQTVRDDGPQAHLKKQGTPSLGGVGFLAAFVIVAAAVAFMTPGNAVPALCVIGVSVLYGLVGFYDDFCKFARGKKEGWKARYRIVVEIFIAALFGAIVMHRDLGGISAVQGIGLDLSFLGNLGWAAAGAFVLVGSVNAVNLSDGLDGLAGGLTTICAAVLGAALFALGQPGLGITALCLSGAALGFLWLNGNPASIFMGDVGAYGLGGALAAIALLGRLELAYAVMGLIFVVEALSVMGQVVSFRATGKRILKMAPLHHHFELCGWPETRVVIRFWTVGVLCGIAGLLLVLGRLS